MGFDWMTILATTYVTLCTWYIRRGQKKDTSKVIRSTAAQSTSDEIHDIVKSLQADMILVKKVIAADQSVDHRAPDKGE